MISVEFTQTSEAGPGQNRVTICHAGFTADINNKSPAWWRKVAAGGEHHVSRSLSVNVIATDTTFVIKLPKAGVEITYKIPGDLRDQIMNIADEIECALPHQF
jgi:hypothetical protein